MYPLLVVVDGEQAAVKQTMETQTSLWHYFLLPPFLQNSGANNRLPINTRQKQNHEFVWIQERNFQRRGDLDLPEVNPFNPSNHVTLQIKNPLHLPVAFLLAPIAWI